MFYLPQNENLTLVEAQHELSTQLINIVRERQLEEWVRDQENSATIEG